MPKRTDKVFHLTVSFFAITLTAVSAVTLLYQRDPDRVKSFFGPLLKSSWLIPDANHDTATHPGARSDKSPPNQNSDVAKKPSFTPSHNSLVDVSAYGRDVPASQVAETKRLLSQYHIVETVSNVLQMNMDSTVRIYLAQNSTDYKSALASLGVPSGDAQRFTRDTGGFTLGDKILIPLYQNKTAPDLANTLGHELTHAFLNYNVASVPSWINEGLAVYDGMKVQSSVSSDVAYGGFARQMAESVVEAARTGELVPLTADESQVLQGTQSYDLELQDWLAVSKLIHSDGYSAFSDYFNRMKQGEDDATAFAASFHRPASGVSAELAQTLKQSADTADPGVRIDLGVPTSFKGYIRILQHGQQSWQGFRINGDTTFRLQPNGRLTGVSAPVETTHDSNPPDNTTTYIDLDSDEALTYNGQRVDNCGFAVDYHYGMYAFVNGWVTLKSGKTIYVSDPTLFGVHLKQIAELSQNPVVPLLTAK